MFRTIVITGATGFIGGALTKRMTSGDWRIKALVRSGSLNKLRQDITAEWVAGDLEDIESLRRLVAGADVIVHCAGAVRGASQSDFDRVNVDGVMRMVHVAAELTPQPQFLLISSLAAREPELSYYAASKFKGEKALASHSGGMSWGVLRPPVVYGPGDRELLPLLQWMFRGIAPLIGSEDKRLSLLYVEDLVEAIVCWLQKNRHQHRSYELHDGHVGGYSWQEIIAVVERLRGKSILSVNIPVFFIKAIASINLLAAKTFGGSPMLNPGKVREMTHLNWIADNNILSADTGWIPHVSLEQGLRQTLGSVK